LTCQLRRFLPGLADDAGLFFKIGGKLESFQFVPSSVFGFSLNKGAAERNCPPNFLFGQNRPY
jgi:hypothetical protein